MSERDNSSVVCQECKVCGKVCMNYARLRTHMVVHDDRVQHPCTVCTKSFKYKHHLKEHMATHTGEDNR